MGIFSFRNCAIFALALALFLPYLTHSVFRFLSFSLDEIVGNIDPSVEDEVLAKRFRQKKVLIIGATRGIGRGIALNLARYGADVTIVGRNPIAGGDVVKNMKNISRNEEQIFKAYTADLSTTTGCKTFTEKLRNSGASYDYLVMTMGVWPDWKNRKTQEGIDKVVAIDLLGRFLVFDGVKSLLKPNARVMNVLGSAFKMKPLSKPDIKDLISGKNWDYIDPWNMMTAICYSADAFVVQAAKRYPEFKFIGTHPGIVHTELTKNTFPSWQIELNRIITSWLHLAISEEECGKIHALILSSENVEKRPATFFNFLLEGRRASDIAYDDEYGSW
eukprot:CAMPEP_0204829564 /NCGR_PEP_ID=MMETSP1346-20131115/7808_1 /ASSEMBLY_ACC=CAM_ASM_000771 /TAXON_ID=215587 /ORGANISM="Aplanochytrium stocchinoi, Strain GSBS06" /LENGTH=331 /DNA_ID=CAMNT_0051959477 /DNA_START=28 /DNA_END=1020 /DNA_ORIENTATION=-